MGMDHSTFAELVDNMRTSGSVITSGTPVKVVLYSGDIVDVQEVKFDLIDGGQIQIIAGPTEDDEENERTDLDDIDDNVGDEVDDQGGMSEYR